MRLPLKLKSADGKEIEFTIATTWEDMTTGEFFAFRAVKPVDIIQALAALSGVPADVWEQVSIETISTLTNLQGEEGYFPLKYLADQIDMKALPLPKALVIDGKDYPVPDEPELTLKQYEWMRTSLENAVEETDAIDSALYILSCYYYPIVTGNKLTENGAKEFMKVLGDKTFITNFFPVSAFFLMKLYGLESVMPKNYIANQPQKKKRPALASSLSLGSSTPSTRSAEGIFSNGKRRWSSLMKSCLQSYTSLKLKLHSQRNSGASGRQLTLNK